MGSQTLTKLPNIDLSKETLKPGNDSWLKTRKEVITALENYGCFIAMYPDIPLKLHNAVFHSLEELFDLPTETKMQNKSSKPLYGYVGQIPMIPLYESMGTDYANTHQGIRSFTNVMWSEGNKGFSETMLSYTKLAAEIEETVVKMIFEEYGVEKHYNSYLNSISYLCRFMKYKEPEMSESKLGFISHTDKSFMSTIHQFQADGLEVKAKDGEWFRVELSPSSFVVMAGDAIMAWSNNRIHSPHHRVIMEGKGKGARYSIAQFSFMEGIVETPEELVDDDHPLQFKPFDHLEYLNFYSKEENRRLECPMKTYCGIY